MAAEYKTYQTDNGKETLDITKNYTVLKQGKGFFKFREENLYSLSLPIIRLY